MGIGPGQGPQAPPITQLWLRSWGLFAGLCAHHVIPCVSAGVKYVVSQLSNPNSTAGATAAAAPNTPVLPVTPHQGDKEGQTLQSGFQGRCRAPVCPCFLPRRLEASESDMSHTR